MDPALGRRGVYPRIRGGSPDLTMVHVNKGSLSPPTRGIPAAKTASSMSARSIPAYAGDPASAPARSGLGTVYPRLRGGSATPESLAAGAKGLSPPTRGILYRE